jgi:hypothetical protein
MKNMKKYFYKFSGLLLIFAGFPMVTFAAVCDVHSFSVKGLGAYLLYPACIINRMLVPFAIVLEIFLVLVGITRYMMNADNETERAKGNKFMMWSVVVLFITVSVWGILGVINNSLRMGQ